MNRKIELELLSAKYDVMITRLLVVPIDGNNLKLVIARLGRL